MPTPAPRPEVQARLPLRVVAAGVGWLGLYALATLLVGGSPRAAQVLGGTAYLVPIGAAAALALRAARRGEGGRRRFWSLLAVSCALWLLGEAVWSFYDLALGRDPATPSLADVFYLASVVLVLPALAIGFGSGTHRLTSWRAALDGSILAATVGLAGFTFLLEPQLDARLTAATATGLAYPLLDVVILVVGITLVAGSGRRMPLPLWLALSAFLVAAVSDALYTWVAVVHDYGAGSWLDLGWQAEAVLLCLAAVAAARPAAEVVREGARPARDHNLPLLLAGTMVTVGIAAADATDGRIVGGTAVLAVFTVLALTLRIQLVAREKDALARRLQASLAEQQRLAVTDGLTGLHNRRFVEEVLAIEAARAGRDGTSLGLIVIDLDRFKQVNDSLGHPAGDAVLAEAARRLASVVRAGDVVARYGGEEFVVVLPRADGQALAQVAERCRAAVAGAPFAAGEASITVTASAGGARMPEDAADVEELVRIADRSLYAAKALGRNQVQIAATGLGPILADDDSSSVVAFLETLSDEIDRRQTGDPHSEPMAAVAASVAARLGLSVGAQRRVALAARFHDLGKVCVPDAILLKPGPLEAREWAIVREHPERGAEIIGLAADLRDVAPGVRAHHERWDGAGYPDRLRGEAIPVEARIVAVCDAWFAMRADRPHRPALDRDEARAELGAGAGTQFDPQVVEAFLAIEPETTKGRLSPAGPS